MAAPRKNGTLSLSRVDAVEIGSLASRVGSNEKIPALLTRMSTCPPPRPVAYLASCRALASSVSSAAMKSAQPPPRPEVRGHLTAAGLVASGQHDRPLIS